MSGNPSSPRGVAPVVPRFLLALAAASLVVAACSGDGGGGSGDPTVLQPTETTGDADDGGASFAGTDPAPEFPDGLDWLNVPRPLSIAELRGKLILLDFWTYGCINCIHIIPDLERLEAEYPDELVVIGVHSAKFENEGDTDNIRNIIARYDLHHPVVNDRDFAVWSLWGASAWPTLVLIDPAGKIVGGHAGEGVYAVFQPVIDALVEEFADEIDRTPIDLERPRPADTVLSFPGKVLADAASGRLFVADTNHHRIVVADLATGAVTAVVGQGAPGYQEGGFVDARFDQPQGMALSADGGTLFVADVGNHAVRAIDLAAGTVTTLAGTGDQAAQYPPAAGIAPAVELTSPWDLVRDGDTLYVAMAGSHQVWAIDLIGGTAAAVAGSGREGVSNGDALRASLAQPSGLAVDASGRVLFADAESSSIRYVDDGMVGLLAGADTGLFDFGLEDGVGSEARFQHPLGVAVGEDGTVFVADTYNSAIRAIAGDGTVTTLAGGARGWQDGPAPRYDEPGGLSFAGGRLYVADTNNHVIRVVDPATGATDTMVLFGLEAFRAPAPDTDVVTLDPVVLAPGDIAVSLEITLPEGHVVNDLAPFTASWAGDGVAVDAGSIAVVAPSFPVAVDLTGLVPSDGTVGWTLATYYCQTITKELCLIDQVVVRVPVTVSPGGATALTIRYEIPPP